jgi:transposase InsO family protein
VDEAARMSAVEYSRAEPELEARVPAVKVHLAPRTLREWRRSEEEGSAGPSRGRPRRGVTEEERTRVVAVLDGLGPRVGVERLRGICPRLPRSEMAELLRRYRDSYAEARPWVESRLTWEAPGRVWAMDHTAWAGTIDGAAGVALGVRDLGSGSVLAWERATATAGETRERLERLFVELGAPLVLKSDNGSAFISEQLKELCERWGVAQLLSPVRRPQYNGSIERTLGWLKLFTSHRADRDGRAGAWRGADLEEARVLSNATARPWGARGPTPTERWRLRSSISEEERADLLDAVAEEETILRAEVITAGRLGGREEARIRRKATYRALLARGFLSVRRRSIPLPIRFVMAARNT